MTLHERGKVVGLLLITVAVAIGLAYVVQENNLRNLPVKTKPPRTVPTSGASPTSTVPTPRPGLELQDETGSIRVANMSADQLLPNGFVVRGTAVAFESRFSWRLLDAKKKQLANGSVSSHQPDAGIPGWYDFPVLFNAVPKTATGTLQVYEASARDGSDIHVVNVPVAFSTSTRAIDIYFSNTKKNPSLLDCSLVYPVSRLVPDGIMPLIAVNALLQGPTKAEIANGYQTLVPAGTAIEGVEDANAQPAIDFNDMLRQGVAGSCLVSAIRSQIEKTATQGASALPPVISINGITDDVLQP